MTAAAKKPADAGRKAMLAKVHMAKKELALTDDNYRDILERVTGQRSAAKCRRAQLHDALAEFQRLGWKPKRGKAKRAGARPLAQDAQAAKIRALWLSLYHLGEVNDPAEAALSAFVARTAGVDALQWLDADTADTAIRALRGWCARVGFAQPNAEEVHAQDAMRARARLEPGGWALAAKASLMRTLWGKLLAAGALDCGELAHFGTWLSRFHGAAAPHLLEPDRADRAIEDLGDWLRRVKAKGGTP